MHTFIQLHDMIVMQTLVATIMSYSSQIPELEIFVPFSGVAAVKKSLKHFPSVHT